MSNELLTREDKVWCAAIAKFESLTADQRARFLEIAEERMPMVVPVMSSAFGDWSSDIQNQIEKARKKAAA